MNSFVSMHIFFIVLVPLICDRPFNNHSRGRTETWSSGWLAHNITIFVIAILGRTQQAAGGESRICARYLSCCFSSRLVNVRRQGKPSFLCLRPYQLPRGWTIRSCGIEW